MKTPKELQPLLDDGIIDGVLRRLKSGKEATVYLVDCGARIRCAKVYKDSQQRGFHKLAEYQEGRTVRGSRDTRALGKGGKHGRSVQEAQWKNAEVEALYRLSRAGVRVPEPYGVFDGVLLMELLLDAEGNPAPRLNDVALEPDQAVAWHAFMIRQVVLMLCAGLIHGDLSEFNVLVGAHGPVIIDLPQAIDAAANNNAFRLFQRDVDNLRDTFGRAAPQLLLTYYAHEIWQHFQAGTLTPDTRLTGEYVFDETAPDVAGVLRHIEEERLEALAKLERIANAEAGI